MDELDEEQDTLECILLLASKLAQVGHEADATYRPSPPLSAFWIPLQCLLAILQGFSWPVVACRPPSASGSRLLACLEDGNVPRGHSVARLLLSAALPRWPRQGLFLHLNIVHVGHNAGTLKTPACSAILLHLLST